VIVGSERVRTTTVAQVKEKNQLKETPGGRTGGKSTGGTSLKGSEHLVLPAITTNRKAGGATNVKGK